MLKKTIIFQKKMYIKVRQYENEIQNLISVYDEILGEMAKTNVRYSEVEDNLLYIEEHVKVINDNQQKYKII